MTGSSLTGNAQMTSLEYSANLVYKNKRNVIKLLLGGEYIDEEQEVISDIIILLMIKIRFSASIRLKKMKF